MQKATAIDSKMVLVRFLGAIDAEKDQRRV
jgi:hypothetical protein